jgi:hypothetical protein
LLVADAAALTTTLRGSRRGSQMATRTLPRRRTGYRDQRITKLSWLF